MTSAKKLFDGLEHSYLGSPLKRLSVAHSVVTNVPRPFVAACGVAKRFKLHPACRWNDGLRMLMGWHDYGMKEVYSRFVAPGMTVIDVGANIGYHSTVLSALVGPVGRVYAFEPDPECYQILEYNVSRSKYRNVTPVQLAVCHKVGTTKFFETEECGTHSLFNVRPNLTRRILTVNTTTIDAFLANHGNPDVGFIKIDTEGAESTVLAGMNGLLSRGTAISIILEFCPTYIETTRGDPKAFLSHLTAEFGQCELILPDGALTAADLSAIDSLMALRNEVHVDLLVQTHR